MARARRREATDDEEQAAASSEGQPETPSAAQRRRLRRLWAQLIRRVYEIDPLTCPECGEEMRILAFILDPPVVRKILDHLDQKPKPEGRDPPLQEQSLAS